jgi:hypothetical protein
MLAAGELGPGGTFLGGALLSRGCLYLGTTIPMIKSGSFSQTSHMIQSLESNGWLALRRHRGKFGGTQPPLAFDREPNA